MYTIIFLKLPSERLGPGASFLCWTQFSMVSHQQGIGKTKKQTNILSNKHNQPCLPHMWGKVLKMPFVSLLPKAVSLCLSRLTSTLQKSCSQAYRGGSRQRKSPLDGVTDFLSKSNTTLQLYFFCQLSFLYWLGSPQTSKNTSKWGLNII